MSQENAVVETQVTEAAADAPVIETADTGLDRLKAIGDKLELSTEGLNETDAEELVQTAQTEFSAAEEALILQRGAEIDAGAPTLSLEEMESKFALDEAPAVEKPARIGGPIAVVKTIYGMDALKELGFSEAFLTTDNRRPVIFGVEEAMPVFDKDYKGLTRPIEVWSEVTGITVLSNEEGSLMVSVLHTVGRLHFMFKKGKRIWSFYLENAEANDAAGAIAHLLESNLQRGDEIYNDTAGLIDNFWAEMLKAVYSEPTVIKMSLNTHPRNPKKNVVLPLRILFNPAKADDVTLSVGGFCYDYPMDKWPTQALSKGLSQFLADKARQDKMKRDGGIIRGNTPHIKKRQEKVVRSSAIQQMASDAPVLAYGRTPPAKPQPVKKSDEQRAEERRQREAEQGAFVSEE